jgi:Fic family protein
MDKLPLQTDLNTINVLKQLHKASFKLGELNGVLRLLPNPHILLNAILLGESKSSSEIENIITTYDDLYKEMISSVNIQSAKEVLRYRSAMTEGVRMVASRKMITVNDMIDLHHLVEPDKGSIRKLPGTDIKNTRNQEVIYTPPQNYDEIIDLLSNLEYHFNNSSMYDPLVNMAVLHYQFESIHPFYDGNGRTGRILNILYLLLHEKIHEPIIYLSKYINDNRQEYYSLLKNIQEDRNMIEPFVIFMLKAIEEMSTFTINFIMDVTNEITEVKKLVKEKIPEIYSAELVENLFFDFYTKNEIFRNKLNISRNTATNYLKKLENLDILSSTKVGKEVVYKNVHLFKLIEKW